MLSQKRKLTLWGLGEGSRTASKFLDVKKGCAKLVEIELSSRDVVECCALSPDGCHAAVVSRGRLKVYCADVNAENSVAKLTVPSFDALSRVFWLSQTILLVTSDATGFLKVIYPIYTAQCLFSKGNAVMECGSQPAAVLYCS